jgi:putative SbcD/Mre11-related phosphoesterase
MSGHPDWLLTPERVAVHRPTATAVIADPHLGYDRVRRRGGEAIPQRAVAEALRPLQNVLARHELKRLVIAGDLLESARCRALTQDVLQELVEWLHAARVELIGVVPGNHDRGLDQVAIGLPLLPDGILLGDWWVVHGDGPLRPGRVVLGHYHPWLRWGRISAPCYLVDEESIVLPAYSADARGVNVRGQGRWRRHHCWAIAGAEVLDLGAGSIIARGSADRAAHPRYTETQRAQAPRDYGTDAPHAAQRRPRRRS